MSHWTNCRNGKAIEQVLGNIQVPGDQVVYPRTEKKRRKHPPTKLWLSPHLFSPFHLICNHTILLPQPASSLNRKWGSNQENFLGKETIRRKREERKKHLLSCCYLLPALHSLTPKKQKHRYPDAEKLKTSRLKGEISSGLQKEETGPPCCSLPKFLSQGLITSQANTGNKKKQQTRCSLL